MQIKTKPMKLALGAAIITLILIGFYAIFFGDDGQSGSASPQSSGATSTIGRDPFKEFLEKQQQGEVRPMVQSSSNQPMQVTNTSSGSPVQPGTDPFKAFLDAQSNAQKEGAATSPFASGK